MSTKQDQFYGISGSPKYQSDKKGLLKNFIVCCELKPGQYFDIDVYKRVTASLSYVDALAAVIDILDKKYSTTGRNKITNRMIEAAECFVSYILEEYVPYDVCLSHVERVFVTEELLKELGIKE